MLAVKMAMELEKSLKRLRALKDIPEQQLRLEGRLNHKLKELFGEAAREALSELNRLGKLPSDTDISRIVKPFENIEAEMQQQAAEVGTEAAGYGRNRTLWLLNKPATSFSSAAERLLRERIFEASHQTMQRLRGDIMSTLSELTGRGLGIDDIAEGAKEHLDGIKDWQAERIARTEVVGSQNMGAHDTMKEYGVEFEQWWTAQDGRVRNDHIEMHGEITRTDDIFSNGLKHPGDRSGPIREWINCRCSVVPFIMPKGKTAPPGKRWFYEWEL